MGSPPLSITTSSLPFSRGQSLVDVGQHLGDRDDAVQIGTRLGETRRAAQVARLGDVGQQDARVLGLHLGQAAQVRRRDGIEVACHVGGVGLGRRRPLLQVGEDLRVFVVHRAHQTVGGAGPFEPDPAVAGGQPARQPGDVGERPVRLLGVAVRTERVDRHLAGAGNLLEVSRAARALPLPRDSPRPVDLLLDGLTQLVTDGPAVAAPTLRQAVDAFATGAVTRDEGLRWGWIAATVLWDEDAGRAIVARQVRLARDAGALEQLPTDLVALAMSDAWRGDFAAAASLVAESDAVAEMTGSRIAPYTRMFLASLRGHQAELASLISVANAKAAAEGQGIAATYAQWAAAILHNGFGRYAEAFTAARQASEHSHLYVSMWALPELIEAATRTGDARVAADALGRLAERTQAGGTDFGLGLEARCRALLSDGAAAEDKYREAIDRLSRIRLRPELARAHLLYGEWLRREGRRLDAREQLRTAHDMLAGIGMEAFAERARRELIATGETVRKRSAETITALTAQEALIARLAGDGRTNPEIGAQLFLSARTVEWHLRRIFTKLGIGSRRELRAALAQLGPVDVSA